MSSSKLGRLFDDVCEQKTAGIYLIMYMYCTTFATKSKEAFGEILTGYILSHTYTVEGNPCIYRYYYAMWIAYMQTLRQSYNYMRV